MSPRIVISAPYPEGAVMSMARSWSAAGSLSQVVVPSRALNRKVARVAGLMPGGHRLGQRLSRSVEELPERCEVLPALELMRLWDRAMRASGFAAAGGTPWKRAFDTHVSAFIPAGTNQIVGMPAACLTTFRLHPDELKVFHAVDGHPNQHNEALLAHYPERLVRSELHSPEQLDRIAEEIELADVVLAPSRIVANGMRLAGKVDFQLPIVPYGVDFGRFSPQSGARRHSAGRSPSFIYVGQISYRKGIPFLVDAFRGSSSSLTLVGPIVQKALVKNLPDNVRYLGVLPHAALAAEMADSDSFVFASVEDACPLAVVEAVAAGLPVVCTDATGSAEMLSADDVRVVASGSSVALRAAIDATSVLSYEERVHRAERIRLRASEGSGLLSWELYAETAFSQIQRAALERDTGIGS